jgi:hypothetical protein
VSDLLHYFFWRQISSMQDNREMPESNFFQTMFDYIECCLLLRNKQDALSKCGQARNQVCHGLAFTGSRRAVDNSALSSEPTQA